MSVSRSAVASPLRVVAESPPARTLEQRVRIDRPQVYARIMSLLGDRVRAAHELMIELGDVLPERMPRNRPLEAEEVEELAWRVYCLTNAMRLSFVRCHPTVVRLAGEWWSADPETAAAYEAFCVAHWN